MRVVSLWVAAASLFIWSNPVVANERVSSEAALIEPVPPVNVAKEAPDDKAIEKRIETVFAQIDSLKTVTISVVSGVVLLAGEASNSTHAERAEKISERVPGVVAVEDNITRTLDIEDNVQPMLGQLRTMTSWLYRATPLIALSMLLMLGISFCAFQLSKWQTLWSRVAPNPFLAELIAHAIKVFGVVLGLVAALNLLGATALLGTILGGAGVVGLAIGFAVRDSLENYISSVMLSLRQPFRSQDYVRIGDHEGVVIRLTSRATILMTPEGNQLRIPNADVFKATILNITRNPQRRFEFSLGVDANDDPIEAMTMGLNALRTLRFVLDQPAPGARITTIGDSNIVLWFSAWIDQRDADFSKCRSVAITATKNALESSGFSLPEPIYRVRFDQAAGLPTSQPSSSTKRESPRPAARSSPPVSGSDRTLSVDVTPDTHLQDMAEQEHAQESAPDLLDSHRPIE